MPTQIDLTRRPSGKERVAFESRLMRLNGEFGKRVIVAEKKLVNLPKGGLFMERGFRVRHGFSYLEKALTTEHSDRRTPPRKFRPPATRISSSQGSTLRLYLLGLAITQMTRKAGGRGVRLPVLGMADELGWTDLVATSASDKAGATYISAKDKRARSVRNALKALEQARLLAFTNADCAQRNYDHYHLLNESETQNSDSEEYKVPRLKEPTIKLPSEFITKSWIHVLEDSEITLLLMLACGRGRLATEELVAIPSDVRLLNYGISYDNYTKARKTLEYFGLIEVTEVGRHHDGKADSEVGMLLHRFKINPNNFAQPALPTVQKVLQHQLKRP